MSATGEDYKRQRSGENDRLEVLPYFHVSSWHSCPRTYPRYDRTGVEPKFFLSRLKAVTLTYFLWLVVVNALKKKFLLEYLNCSKVCITKLSLVFKYIVL